MEQSVLRVHCLTTGALVTTVVGRGDHTAWLGASDASAFDFSFRRYGGDICSTLHGTVLVPDADGGRVLELAVEAVGAPGHPGSATSYRTRLVRTIGDGVLKCATSVDTDGLLVVVVGSSNDFVGHDWRCETLHVFSASSGALVTKVSVDLVRRQYIQLSATAAGRFLGVKGDSIQVVGLDGDVKHALHVIDPDPARGSNGERWWGDGRRGSTLACVVPSRSVTYPYLASVGGAVARIRDDGVAEKVPLGHAGIPSVMHSIGGEGDDSGVVVVSTSTEGLGWRFAVSVFRSRELRAVWVAAAVVLGRVL